MKKILVPVDFSPNARKAIRFALQWAAQLSAEVIFYHLLDERSPQIDAGWDYTYYTQQQDKKRQLAKNKMDKLIQRVYQPPLQPDIPYVCVCQTARDVAQKIIEYAQQKHIDCIITGARGSSTAVQLFGSTTTKLMTESPIPVLVVPAHFRLKPITDLCYASDMRHLETEIKKVLDLKNALGVKLRLMHFDYQINLQQNNQQLHQWAQKYEAQDVHFQYLKLKPEDPLNTQIQQSTQKFKPSVLILFTQQNRSWFERFIWPSDAVRLSLISKVPLLIYRK